ncbi:ankyrin repeat domain-containing protein [Mycoplasmatota bacterium]|nr:ankyrin repeat domain-containing protein [Mycoplasmatota bacterium]
MFKNSKVKKMFEDDEPKIVFYLESKKMDLNEIFKDDEDLIEKSIKNHKNTIAEAAITYCSNINHLNKNNMSYLMTAIKYDNLPMFKKLLETDIKLDFIDNKRESVLFYVINNPNSEYFELIIEKEIDIKGFNLQGENTLIYAYKHDRKEICLYLLEKNVFINHINKDGNTILHYAVKNEDIDFSLLLIDYGADPFIKNYNHETALDIANGLGIDTPLINKIIEIIDKHFKDKDHDKLLELLLEYEDVEDYCRFNIPFLIAVFSIKYNNKFIFDKILRKNDLLNNIDYRGKSLLMYCVEFGMFICARKIIYLDSNLNLKDSNNKTILFTLNEQLNDISGDKTHQEEYKLLFNELLERRVDVNCQDNEGNTILLVAIKNKQNLIIDRLIEYPLIDINIMNNEGLNALLIAYQNHDSNTLQKIIRSRKAEINTIDKNQNSLILLSLFDDNLELFDELLNYGANLNLKYKEGKTLLMIALQMQKKRFIAKIFEHPNFDVDLQDDSGMTALMHAIKSGNIRVVEALLKCGADSNLKDNKGDAAIFFALEIEDFEIAKLLRSYSENS